MARQRFALRSKASADSRAATHPVLRAGGVGAAAALAVGAELAARRAVATRRELAALATTAETLAAAAEALATRRKLAPAAAAAALLALEAGRVAARRLRRHRRSVHVSACACGGLGHVRLARARQRARTLHL